MCLTVLCESSKDVNKSHCLPHIDSNFVLKGKIINVQALLSSLPDVL